MSVILVKGDNQAHILAEGCYESREADVSANNFSAFPDWRRCKK